MLLHDRLNTRNLLRRKTFHLDCYHCVVRNYQFEETLQHLFLSCPLLLNVGIMFAQTREHNLSVLEAFEDIKRKLNKPFFMEIVILAAWAIWITRNNKIFENIQPTFQRWKSVYFYEPDLLRHRMKSKHADAYFAWLLTVM